MVKQIFGVPIEEAAKAATEYLRFLVDKKEFYITRFGFTDWLRRLSGVINDSEWILNQMKAVEESYRNKLGSFSDHTAAVCARRRLPIDPGSSN